jgi:hypothetical protein
MPYKLNLKKKDLPKVAPDTMDETKLSTWNNGSNFLFLHNNGNNSFGHSSEYESNQTKPNLNDNEPMILNNVSS